MSGSGLAQPAGAGRVNILCIKWGARYGAHYVNRLYHGVHRHLDRPLRFICFTDDGRGLDPPVEIRPLPEVGLPEAAFEFGGWPKLGLLEKGLADLSGPCLFLDLDVVIVGPLGDFFDFLPGAFCIIRDWVPLHRRVFARRPGVGNSSVFRFQAGEMQYVLERMRQDIPGAMEQFRNEQRFLSHVVVRKCWWPAPWVVSFKRHCIPAFPLNLLYAPRLPAAARIVAFHGEPKPEQARDGMCRLSRLYRAVRPAPWIREHWGGSGQA